MAAGSRIDKIISVTMKDIESVVTRFDNVYVMFSGGRDSLVTLHLLSKVLGPSSIEAIFIDTGIATPGLPEYVEETCKAMNIKLHIIRPEYDYFELVLKKGFPTITRRWCKEYLKLRPLKKFVTLVNDKNILLVTGVRAEESWMKNRARKLYEHPILGVSTYAPIFEWHIEDVKAYIEMFSLMENPLYKLYGKAYDCWCSVYKSPADFAILAINNPDFFARFVETEKKLRSGGSGLYYGKKKIYFRDIASDPKRYLTTYPRKYLCPLCRSLVSGVPM